MTTRKQTSFRLREDLLETLKVLAQKENRTLNNYVESVLLKACSNHEPNEVTAAALMAAEDRTEYKSSELYDTADEMLKDLI